MAMLVLLPGYLISQNLVIKLGYKPEIFKVDKIGNIYVYKSQLLKKYSPQGKLLCQYSNFDKGNLHSLDVSDPLKVMLFYKDFNQLIFLDSRLSVIGNPIQLSEMGFNSVATVCKSKQMAIWLHDDYENKLVKFGFNPRGILQTINFENTNLQHAHIDFMIESGNELFLHTSDSSVWIFDSFGSQLKQLEIKVGSDFQIVGNTIIYNNGKYIFVENFIDKNPETVSFTMFSDFDDVKNSLNNYYFLNADSIVVLKKN